MPYYPVAEISQLGSGQLDSEVPLAGVVLVYMLEALNALYIRMRKEPAREYARERSMGTAPQ